MAVSLSNDQFRNRLTFFLVGSFVGIIPLFIFWGMPQTSENIVTYMVGQLSGMALMALGFYFTREDKKHPDEVKITNTEKEAVPMKDTSDVNAPE